MSSFKKNQENIKSELQDRDTTNQQRKKRKYSRNGCKECKRRKLKCDEGKPHCWNCLHLSKECLYEKLIKFTDTRTFTIQSTKGSTNGEFIDLQTKARLKKQNIKKTEPAITVSTSTSTSNSNSISASTTSINNDNRINKPENITKPNPVKKSLPPSDSSFHPTRSTFGNPIPFGSSNELPMMQNPPESFDSSSHGRQPTIASLLTPVTSLLDSNMNESMKFDFSPGAKGPGSNNSEIIDNIFTDANTLITDLNGLIKSFDFDFPLAQTYDHLSSDNQQIPTSDIHQVSLNSKPPYDSISPTNYSVNSNETPLEEELDNSNEEYIQSLTKSLSKDYKLYSSSANSTLSSNISMQRSATDNIVMEGISTSNDAHSTQNMVRSSSYNRRYQVSPSTVTRSTPLFDSQNHQKQQQQQQQTRKTLPAYPPPSFSILSSPSSERFEYLFALNNSISQNDLVGLANFFQWSVSSSHINYLKIFITKIQMNLLPFTTTFLHNSIVNCFLLQAKNSPHLLFALLAIAARYEIDQARKLKASEESNQKIRHHNKFREHYVKSCLKSLDAIFDSKPKILNNIESLLMTILILASDYSASTGSQWRAHLRGAKDLLIKYCKFKPISLELSIINVWFYSMETLACLTVPSGGTIHDFDELHSFLSIVKSDNDKVGLTLKKFQFLYPGHYFEDEDYPNKKSIILGENAIESDRKLKKFTSFNLYLGFNDDIMEINKESVLVIEALKTYDSLDEPSQKNRSSWHPTMLKVLNSRGQVQSNQLLKMMTIIKKAKSFTLIANEAPYCIPINSAYHPLNTNGYHYNNPTGENLVMSCYIHNTNPLTSSTNDFENWYSWFDLSQQLFVDASLLKVLTMSRCFNEYGLSIKNPLVQDVVERMLLGLSSLVQLNGQLTKEDLDILNAYYNSPDDDVSSKYTASSRSSSEVEEDSSKFSGDEVDSDSRKRDENKETKGDHASGVQEEEEEEDDNELVHKDNEEENLKIHKESKLDTMVSSDSSKPKDKNSPNLIPNESSISNSRKDTLIINFDKYLYYQFDNRLVMVQWPLLLCGLCCYSPRQKLIIDCCFNALINFGVGSGEISLMKLKKLWSLQKHGTFDYDNYDLFNDENDYVPFS